MKIFMHAHKKYFILKIKKIIKNEKTSRLYLEQMLTMQRFYFSVLDGFSFNILNFTRRLFLKEKG